ncbi:uncharacterized protein SPPG_09320 [Spizellomyces punctatus DAOM BR117]|uniref:Zn(2)-C6 fungal-type domain-containing protein n=1 Tax=Spizellomyces punctatus (strain DAOM BR117) TaxID=645134 RepID=A0A0L0HBB8_SPIPD|nr:uncharacterized protein SPPG_09320 [Spizellomyces punctatus DAOM BR117]KNC98880.1 hypothetical protein SPPG_09320 [Spizellomyces punctatus DAOM BR117]|eukprot:XP_016606920.1 hypothetical protein SPPG_09320 [Spizellomyces punctatus DAOM BR117]
MTSHDGYSDSYDYDNDNDNDMDNDDDQDEFDSGPTGGKRKRITQACDACNKKKVKCDGIKPTCSNCLRSSSSCSYSRGAKKRGPRAGYIESLENRLKEMEALLKPLHGSDESLVSGLSSNETLDQANPSRSSSTSMASLDLANSTSSAPQFHNDTMFTQHGVMIKDQIPFSNSFFMSPSIDYAGTSCPPGPTAQQQSTGYVPPDATNDLLELYFHYIGPIMPLIHKRTFYQNIANQSPLMLNAMYALAARFSTHPAIRTNPDAFYSSGDNFYIKAREMVDHYMDVPNATTVNALLILATYAAESGRGSAAWMYSGMAIRMAQELKLNVEPDFEEAFAGGSRMGWLEKETRRRLWWCCFVLDRYAGAAADRSMIINEKDCKVYLPSSEISWESLDPSEIAKNVSGLPTPDSYQIAVLTSTNAFTPGIPAQSPYGYFILLVKIFGKIVEYSNLFKTAQRTNTTPALTPDADYQLSVLDASLRDWFGSLPEWMRVIGDSFVPELTSTNPPSWHIAYLHIFYHTCVIVLHRPKMMVTLRDIRAKSGSAAATSSPSFVVCLSSANEISAVLQKVMKTNPDFLYFSPFVAYCIFQSGLVHLMTMQLGATPGGARSQATGEDKEMEAQAESNVEVHMKALKGVGRYWFMAGRLFTMLKSLVGGGAGSVALVEGGLSMSDRRWVALKERTSDGNNLNGLDGGMDKSSRGRVTGIDGGGVGNTPDRDTSNGPTGVTAGSSGNGMAGADLQPTAGLPRIGPPGVSPAVPLGQPLGMESDPNFVDYEFFAEVGGPGAAWSAAASSAGMRPQHQGMAVGMGLMNPGIPMDGGAGIAMLGGMYPSGQNGAVPMGMGGYGQQFGMMSNGNRQGPMQSMGHPSEMGRGRGMYPGSDARWP